MSSSKRSRAIKIHKCPLDSVSVPVYLSRKKLIQKETICELLFNLYVYLDWFSLLLRFQIMILKILWFNIWLVWTVQCKDALRCSKCSTRFTVIYDANLTLPPGDVESIAKAKVSISLEQYIPLQKKCFQQCRKKRIHQCMRLNSNNWRCLAFQISLRSEIVQIRDVSVKTALILGKVKFENILFCVLFLRLLWFNVPCKALVL